VGGGVSGALIARRLVNLGMEVIIVDSRDVGMGSAMASTAILSYEPDVHLIDLISQIGKRAAVRAYRAGLEALESLEKTIETLGESCDFRRRESLYLASNRKDTRIVRRECATRIKHGFKVELLTCRQLGDSYSLRAPCAILTRQAAEVNPLKLTLALVRSAQKRGLKIFSHTVVDSYHRQGKESLLITSDDFHIRARHVVFATGYETQQILKQKHVRLVSSYAIASSTGTKFPRGREWPVIWESARPYLYVHSTVDGRIVAGGEDVDFVDEAKRDELLASKTKILVKKIRKMFPDLSWKLASAWTGTFAESKDGLPYIGSRKDFPGAQFALGYGGNGITFATAVVATPVRRLLSYCDTQAEPVWTETRWCAPVAWRHASTTTRSLTAFNFIFTDSLLPQLANGRSCNKG
jgi:glycine/D-amino acid oxidase-like deaminating enzyme